MKTCLLIIEIPAGTLPKAGPGFATADPAYLTVVVPVTAVDVLKAKNAWICHKSQYTAQEGESLVNAIWGKKRPMVYFRPFITPGKMQHSLFYQ